MSIGVRVGLVQKAAVPGVGNVDTVQRDLPLIGNGAGERDGGLGRGNGEGQQGHQDPGIQGTGWSPKGYGIEGRNTEHSKR